jgi:hypothetical protein
MCRLRVFSEHLGNRDLSSVELLIAMRAIEMEWSLRQMDAKAADPATPADEVRECMKLAISLSRELRMTLQGLGLRPAPPTGPTWQDALAGIRGEVEPETADAGRPPLVRYCAKP